MLFEQTTTIGVRIYEARRKVLERELLSVETPYGAVTVKLARRNGKVVNVAPEYEDCQRLATEKGIKSLHDNADSYDILIVPDVVLKEGDDVFLDDVSLRDLEDATGLKTVVTDSTPQGFIDTICEF